MKSITPNSTKSKSPTNLIYLAGIIDGEGHFDKRLFTNGRGVKYLYPRISINQKDERLIDWLKANYGGCKTPWRDKRRPDDTYYRWELKGKAVEELARQLQPYLIVKKEQVLRVLNETLPVIVEQTRR